MARRRASRSPRRRSPRRAARRCSRATSPRPRRRSCAGACSQDSRALGRRRAHLRRRDRARVRRALRPLDADLGARPAARAPRGHGRHHADFAAALQARARVQPRGPLRARSRARRGAPPRHPPAQPAPAGRAPADGLQSGHLRRKHERSGCPRFTAARGLHPGDPVQGRPLRGLDPAPSRRWNLFAQQPVPFAGRGSAHPADAARRSQQDPAAGQQQEHFLTQRMGPVAGQKDSTAAKERDPGRVQGSLGADRRGQTPGRGECVGSRFAHDIPPEAARL